MSPDLDKSENLGQDPELKAEVGATPAVGQEQDQTGSAASENPSRAKAGPAEGTAASPDNADKAGAATVPPAGGAGNSQFKDKKPTPAVQNAHRAGQKPPKPRPEDEGMPLLEHLNELRWVISRIGIIIIVGFFVCYGFSKPFYDFISAPLLVNLPPGSQMIYTSPQGLFLVYLKVSLMASVLLTSPFTFYQIWAFIAPGLYQEEKKSIMPLALCSALFFLVGAAFCYLAVLPVAFKFFMGFATDLIVPQIEVSQYLGFTLKLLLAFGVVFEMPLFAYFLGGMGILTPDMMRSKRKYAILGIFIAAALLTPPDVFSQIMMAIPMLGLYEVSIHIAGWSRKRKLAKDEEYKRMKEGKAPEDAQAEPKK